MISHFADLDQPKRTGINTFHVQHAQYENEQIRRELGHFKPSQFQWFLYLFFYFNKTKIAPEVNILTLWLHNSKENKWLPWTIYI